MTHVTFRLTAKNRDQLRNPTLGSRVWATFTFFTRTVFLHTAPSQSDMRRAITLVLILTRGQSTLTYSRIVVAHGSISHIRQMVPMWAHSILPTERYLGRFGHFAKFTGVPDTQTERATFPVIAHIHAIHAMRPDHSSKVL